MLKKIRQLHKFKKPFYGLNCGTFGFLMNKIRKRVFSKNYKKFKKTYDKSFETKFSG